MNEETIRKEKYNKVKTPEELLKFMDENIKYGIYGTNNKVYDGCGSDTNNEFQLACRTKYALCDEERILKYGYGHCWDQVELERAWFSKNKYEYKTFFIWFCFEHENSYYTHTYLVYKENDKYCYFEHADSANKGIHKFSSYKEAIKYQMEKHIEFNKECGNLINDEVLTHLQVYEFKIQKYGINESEYFDNLFNSKLIYNQCNFVNNLILK